MAFLAFKRIINSGFKNFSRQIGLNMATTFVLAITVILLTSLVYVDGLSKKIFDNLQKQIGVTVYFNIDAPAEQILALRDNVGKLSGVTNVDYVSREDAFKQFSDKYSEDPTVSKTIEIVGENPLPASLRIKAATLNDYEEVVKTLGNESYADIVGEISYPRTEDLTRRIFSMAKDMQTVGLVVGVFMALIVMIIVFSTVRLAVHNLKEEIGVMKMLGASNWYVRGPYMIQGFLCGLIAALISILFFSLASYFLSPQFYALSGGFDLFGFFTYNLSTIIWLNLGAAIGMGVIFNYLAVRRYMNV